MWYWPVFFVVTIASSVAVALELLVISRADRHARKWAALAAASALAVPTGILLHNVASALTGGEEGVTFILVLLVAPAGLMVSVLGAGVVTLRRARRLAGSILLAGAGMGLFFLYSLFALVVTSIEGTNPSYQGAIEIVVLPIAALAMAAGATATAANLLAGRRRASESASTPLEIVTSPPTPRPGR